MTPKQMVSLLEKKLSKEEFFRLFELMDGDPPAGPLWEVLAEQAEKLCPEEFACEPQKV